MSVTLQTNLGDIKIEVFCESVPKTAEVSKEAALSSEDYRIDLATELPCLVRVRLL